MKTIDLGKGLQAQCSVNYGNDEPELDRPAVKPGQKTYQDSFRSVEIGITVTKDGNQVAEYQGKSFCSPTDRWNRVKGRRYAIRRAFDQDSQNGKKLDKSARLTLIQSLIPWVFEDKNETPEAEAAEQDS